MMKDIDFVAMARKIATQYKTLYVMGCFGAPMTESNKSRYINHHEYNRRPGPKAAIQAATADTFGFDCVCLLKGILWGWNGNRNNVYGGATYASNGVPDIDADFMIQKCAGVSTNFADIIPGEMLWKTGHAGIYIGNGMAVECTPAWSNCVQITDVQNILVTGDRPARTWTKHGRLPWVEYDEGLPFTDVEKNSWSYADIAKCYKEGLIKGKTHTLFKPKDYITREEACAMFSRLMEKGK